MAKKSDIFGYNPFPKFNRDTKKAFNGSTGFPSSRNPPPTRSNGNGYSRPRTSYGNNRDNDSQVDVYIHDPYEDRIRDERNRENNVLVFKLLLIGVAIYAAYWVLNQIWLMLVYPIILFTISIKYYVILTIYLIGFVMVTLYLEKKNINRPYSFLGGIVASGILAVTIMSFFGLI